MNLIISLISGQTTPNVQFINEFAQSGDKHLFVTSDRVIDRCDWIKKALSLTDQQVDIITVDAFSMRDIQIQLSNYDYTPYDRLLVNITAGTKIMSMGVYDYFYSAPLNTEIYYLTGHNKEYFRVEPEFDTMQQLTSSLTLRQYIYAHGLEYDEHRLSGQREQAVLTFGQWYINRPNNDFKSTFNSLKQHRNHGRLNTNCVSGLRSLIEQSGFELSHPDQLMRHEVSYFTGGWFEEYIYYKVRNYFNLHDDQVTTGVTISMNKQQNEFDVVFIHNGGLYLIECKTHIMNKRVKGLAATTLYKSASLDDMLGLHARAFVLTLNNREEISSEYFIRGDNYGVKLISLETIKDDELLKNEILTHKPNRI